MLRARADKDRIINEWPASYNECSPYKADDFSEKVKDACVSNRTVTTGLKISKAIFVGDVGVGKTCLVNRFCHAVFDKDYKATIGVDFEVERFDILQIPYNLQIWDTAGQERFKCIASSYYRGAHAVVVVCDVNDLESIQNVPRWLEDALAENASDPVKFLVATKKDLCSDATFKAVERQACILARRINAEFWAVSSKTGENVRELFFRMAVLAFEGSVLRELEGMSRAPQIGNDLISLNRNPGNVFEKKDRKKCSCK